MSEKIKNHWNKFYQKFQFNQESSFAKFLVLKFKNYKSLHLLDIACGNARDTNFFNSMGFKSEGLDFSSTVIKKNKKNFSNINFYLKDICKPNFKMKKKYDILYSRFFLHAINEESEHIFFKNCIKIFKKNSFFFLEFRTSKDPLIKKGKAISKYEKVFGHYRRFINLKEFKKKIIYYGFKIHYLNSGYNYAKFKNQNPHIARVILKRNDS